MLIHYLIIGICLWILAFGLSVFTMQKAENSGIIDVEPETIIVASVLVPLFAMMFAFAMYCADRVR